MNIHIGYWILLPVAFFIVLFWDLIFGKPKKNHMVFICSPYRGNVKENIKNAKRYCKYAVMLRKLPVCPHLFFTRFLDDTIASERDRGIELGLECLKMCDELWVFPCNGITEGMQREIDFAKEHKIETLYVYIP